MTQQLIHSNRRRLVGASLAAGGLMAGGSLLSIGAKAAGKTKIDMQLGWLIGGNQIGEIVAKKLGYFEQGGHRLRDPARRPEHRRRRRRRVGPLRPRPGVVEPVADAGGVAGAADQVLRGRRPEAPVLLLLAEEEADPQRPGHGRQEDRHPVHRHHPAASALLAKNKIDEKAVTIVPIGADMTPLMTGQVDAVTGWLTNTTALKVLGAERVDMALWDTGVKLYALPYYATTKTLQTQGDALAGFVRASAKGWHVGRQEPRRRGRHAGQGVPEPRPRRRARGRRRDARLQLRRRGAARRAGAAMDPANWQDQIALYSELGQFTAQARRRSTRSSPSTSSRRRRPRA